MPRLRPFAALRPPPSLAARVAAPPYDVLDRAEARAICDAEALSFLHVTRADAVLPDSVDPHDPSVYEAAKQALDKLRAEGALVADEEPALYAYEQSAKLAGKQVSQTGLFGCCHVEDYTRGAIKRHELTRRVKEDDRVAHALATRVHAGPVFLAHRPEPGLKEVIAAARAGEPLYDVTAPDGVRHRLWRIDSPDPAVEAAARLDAFYIADGHHRAAMAARVAAQLTDVPEAAWFPCVLFDADELNVLPYHRVVRDLRGLDAAGMFERLSAIGDVEALRAAPTSLGPTEVAAYVERTWCRVALHDVPDPQREPVRSLAYVMLAERVLDPVLGITDQRTDSRIDFVGGIRGTAELERRVDAGVADIAFAMPAVRVEQIMAVADAGAIMPPKSTWFEPKLRSGFLVHTF